jgi:hypothetical protein
MDDHNQCRHHHQDQRQTISIDIILDQDLHQAIDIDVIAIIEIIVHRPQHHHVGHRKKPISLVNW